MVLFEDEKDHLPELKTLLRELFNTNSADTLDFGIYRIMNHKKDRIEKFIDEIDKDVIEIMAGKSEYGNINCEKCFGTGLYCDLKHTENKRGEITCYCYAPKRVFDNCISSEGADFISFRGYTYHKIWTHEVFIERQSHETPQ